MILAECNRIPVRACGVIGGRFGFLFPSGSAFLINAMRSTILCGCTSIHFHTVALPSCVSSPTRGSPAQTTQCCTPCLARFSQNGHDLSSYTASASDVCLLYASSHGK